MPSNNPLPAKENAHFKRILKCYEQKQYKTGLKYAKLILTNSKFSEHGETLAMKGLTLNCLGKKEEATDYIKRGLRNDLKSHVCWHVYGLLQRSEKKYDEAIKCYRNALRWDKDNLQILRDLSLLQIQMRDLEGYKETRYQLLLLRPTQRASWIGYAMSHHLLKDYDMALKVLEEFRKTQTPKSHDYEHSELLLYQAMVMLESGALRATLEHLELYQHQICDRLSLMEYKAEIYVKLSLMKEAESLYRTLLDRNPENWAYYSALETCLGLHTEEERVKLYTELSLKYPRAQAPKRLPLNFVSGERFERLLDDYVRRALRKGVPPLFVNIRALYSQPDKVPIMDRLFNSYYQNLSNNGTLDKEGVEGAVKESPTVFLWLLYFLSQHCDYLGRMEEALRHINAAIAHTPTLIELYLVKARIYKHAANIHDAVVNLVEAQSLDTADRYINSKCAKYMIRANQLKEAEEMCSKFTREGSSAVDNLHEMQCMWFETECAFAFSRLSRPGEALKKCQEIDRHFSEIIEDQFDFHTYCMRKMTLRSYFELLRLEDHLRDHEFYFKAAKCAIQVYIGLHDKPYVGDEDIDLINTENLSESELKKLKRKKKKAEKRAEQLKQQQNEQVEKKEQHNKAKQQQQETEVEGSKEEELDPLKLVKTETPLEEAIKFLRPLQMFSPTRIETHLLAFEIFYRKDKALLMLQSVYRASQIDAENPQLHSCVIKMLDKVSNRQGFLTEPAESLLVEGVRQFRGGKSLMELNDEFVERHRHSLLHRLSGGQVMYHLDSSLRSKALNLATHIDNATSGVTVTNCLQVMESLRRGDFGECREEEVAAFRSKCLECFPLATVFDTEQRERVPDDMFNNHVGNGEEMIDDVDCDDSDDATVLKSKLENVAVA